MTAGWAWLLAAGLFEIVWASALKHADGFTRPRPTALGITAAIASFWMLALALRVLPMGVAYAAWTGIGIMGTALVGAALFHEALSAGQMVSLALILSGIAGLNLFSS
jgi:quaternary ammonium compound-resistance protein SugE